MLYKNPFHCFLGFIVNHDILTFSLLCLLHPFISDLACMFLPDLAQSDDLPSIDKFDDSLEDEDSGLGTEKPPPLLYDNAQQKEMHKYVDELKQSVADEEIAAYLEEFEKKIEEEIIEVGDISVEDVQVSHNAQFFHKK